MRETGCCDCDILLKQRVQPRRILGECCAARGLTRVPSARWPPIPTACAADPTAPCVQREGKTHGQEEGGTTGTDCAQCGMGSLQAVQAHHRPRFGWCRCRRCCRGGLPGRSHEAGLPSPNGYPPGRTRQSRGRGARPGAWPPACLGWAPRCKSRSRTCVRVCVCVYVGLCGVLGWGGLGVDDKTDSPLRVQIGDWRASCTLASPVAAASYLGHRAGPTPRRPASQMSAARLRCRWECRHRPPPTHRTSSPQRSTIQS